MLRQAYDNLKKHYFDPAFRGLDLEARFREYDERIKSAATLNEGLAMVGAFLDGLNDSHTFFVPPARPYDFDYGYILQAFGDTVRVSKLRPGSDAAAKLQVGQEVTAINDVTVNRARLPAIWRILTGLSPQPATKLSIKSESGAVQEIVVATRTRPGRPVLDLSSIDGEDIWQLIRQAESGAAVHEYIESGIVMIWRMPEFDMDDVTFSQMTGTLRKHKALILDLRGNPGGRVDLLTRMVGAVFPKDVHIGERHGRKPMKPMVAKGTGDRAYTGEIVVLVDSQSGSAAELFARVMQLEGRGTVIGDRTSGSVMQSLGHAAQYGVDTVISYYFSVTDADVIMKDGKTIEGTGVVPDDILIPSAVDLAEGNDPVLSRAAGMFGVNLTPQAAGRMFPFHWKPF
jgi:C-terminal processing protease CtpA/Prc